MRDDEILEVLLDWNFWEKKQETGIERQGYLSLILPFINTQQAIVITGVRRSGKSTIMLQIAKKLIEAGTDPTDILIVNLEDYRFYGLSLSLLGKIYETYLKKVAVKGNKKKRILMLDEIHRVEGWERFARTLIDKKDAKLILSGSNTELMEREYANLLTGRHVKFVVFPLRFREFLMFKGIEINTELELLAKRIEIEKLLDEYLEYGSFPEVVLADKEAKKKMLVDYTESILVKDVAERHRIKEREKLRALARYYLSNISTKVTFNRLKDGLTIPLRTVERFSSYLEEAYLIMFLKRFSFKVKEQEKAPRKVYAIDLGLSNAVGFKFTENIGRCMENAVFLELMKTHANEPDFEMYYWQNPYGKEVDFVIKKGGKVAQLIQVCFDIKEKKTYKREISALLAASSELKCTNLLVITKDYESKEKIKGKTIRFVPLWKWLTTLE